MTPFTPINPATAIGPTEELVHALGAEAEYRIMCDDTSLVLVCDMMRRLYAEDRAASGEVPRSFRRTLEFLLSNPARGQVTLIVDRGAVVGYALLIPYWSNEFGGTVLFVDELFVLPEARSRGHGRGLFHWIEQERPFDAVAALLEVSLSNHRARRLYGSLGFRERTNTTLARLMPTRLAVGKAGTASDAD